VSAPSPLVDVAGLSKTVPGGWALRDASCRVGRGEFVAIMGVSGSGKTTLLSLLGLLDTPSGGTYRFDGADVGRLGEAARNRLRGERVGFVFQNSYLMADDTVAGNVALPLRVRGTPARLRRVLVADALARVGLAGFETQRAGELSGGEKQRVALARAIVGCPDVVLADEPTGALDSASSERLVALLRRIAAQGTAVVVVTHDPLVAAGADRTIHLTDGRTGGTAGSPPATDEVQAITGAASPGDSATGSSSVPDTTLLPVESAGGPARPGNHTLAPEVFPGRDGPPAGRGAGTPDGGAPPRVVLRDAVRATGVPIPAGLDARLARHGLTALPPVATPAPPDPPRTANASPTSPGDAPADAANDRNRPAVTAGSSEPGRPAAAERPGGTRAVRWAQEVATGALSPLARPLRAGLVLLAYLLGVAALVGAVGLAQSATGQIVARLTDAASSQVIVQMSGEPGPFLLDPTLPDGAAARAARLTGVILAVPVRTYGGAANPMSRLPGGDARYGGRIYVTETAYLDSHGYQPAQGSIALLTNTWGGPVVVLGTQAARDLDIPQPGPGVQLWLGHHPVDVIGILAPTGDVLVDDAVFFSRGADGWLTNWVSTYLLVRTQRGYAEPLARALPLALAPENPGSVQVSTTSQLALLQAGINSDLARLLGILAWVILVLSALTAGTTMFLSVQHRAPEIALRRAMGASRASIWRIFTYEGVLIGTAGGVLGGAAGTGLVWAAARTNHWPCCLGVTVVLLGLAAGLATGIIASTIPALYAAHRDPAQILRTV